MRRCKRRRAAWLREKEVAWWDAKAQQVQAMISSVALGDVCSRDIQVERGAWAEHFRLIGEGTGSVDDRMRVKEKVGIPKERTSARCLGHYGYRTQYTRYKEK